LPHIPHYFIICHSVSSSHGCFHHQFPFLVPLNTLPTNLDTGITIRNLHDLVHSQEQSYEPVTLLGLNDTDLVTFLSLLSLLSCHLSCHLAESYMTSYAHLHSWETKDSNCLKNNVFMDSDVRFLNTAIYQNYTTLALTTGSIFNFLPV
jgi:hypothetical protein